MTKLSDFHLPDCPMSQQMLFEEPKCTCAEVRERLIRERVDFALEIEKQRLVEEQKTPSVTELLTAAHERRLKNLGRYARAALVGLLASGMTRGSPTLAAWEIAEKMLAQEEGINDD